MDSFVMQVQMRWSDLDPNLHVRHSVYFDWAAMCRLSFMKKNGISMDFMLDRGFGPMIFREEAKFLKEIRMEDNVTINLALTKARKDFSRWSMQHEIKKDDILAAIITVDGAWINVRERKLFVPPQEIITVIENLEHGQQFEWLDENQ